VLVTKHLLVEPPGRWAISDLRGLDERLDDLRNGTGLHLDVHDDGDGSDSEGCDSDAAGVGLGEDRLLCGDGGDVRGGVLGHDGSFLFGWVSL
jgi:hypothetical protein